MSLFALVFKFPFCCSCRLSSESEVRRVSRLSVSGQARVEDGRKRFGDVHFHLPLSPGRKRHVAPPSNGNTEFCHKIVFFITRTSLSDIIYTSIFRLSRFTSSRRNGAPSLARTARPLSPQGGEVHQGAPARLAIRVLADLQCRPPQVR